MINRFNPDTIAAPFTAYSQGVEVQTGARTIYVAGQVGVYPDGTLAEGMAAQTAQAWRNVEAILKAKGMDLHDLVETRTYITNRDDIPGYREGRAEVFGTGDDGPRPAAAMLLVAGLAQPAWKIEICAVAAKA